MHKDEIPAWLALIPDIQRVRVQQAMKVGAVPISRPYPDPDVVAVVRDRHGLVVYTDSGPGKRVPETWLAPPKPEQSMETGMVVDLPPPTVTTGEPPPPPPEES